MLRTQIQKLFDNPVYRILYSRNFVKKMLNTGMICPLIFLAGLLVLYYIYSRTFSSVISLGILIFIFLSSSYLIISILLALITQEDPLRKSLSQHVADQLVITGITPWVWLKGHLLFTLINWLYLTVFFLPIMYLCWLLGGVHWSLPLLIVCITLIFMITTHFIPLMFSRTPVTGVISVMCIIFTIAASIFVLFAVPAKCTTFLPILQIPAAFTPLPLILKTVSIYSNDLFIQMFSIQISRFASLPLLITTFFASNILFWIYATISIIAGLPRAHFDISDKGITTKPTRFSAVSNPSESPSNRTLSLQGLFLLFHQNTFSKHYPKFEFLSLTIASCFTGILLALIEYQNIVHTVEITGLVILITVILVLFNSFSVCFSSSVVKKSPTLFKILFPIYFNWLLRTIFIMIFIFSFFTFSENNIEEKGLILILPMFIILGFVFSLFSSTGAKTFFSALSLQLLCYLVFAIFVVITTLSSLFSFCGWDSLRKLNTVPGRIFSTCFLSPIDFSSEISREILTLRLSLISASLFAALLCMLLFYLNTKTVKHKK